MAIHDQMSYRNYSRVKNPSRSTLGDVVNSADVQMADEGYSPYGSLIDDTGAEQMVKLEDLSSQAEVLPALPLGSVAVYNDLLGINLTEQEVYEVYMNVKSGASVADIAVNYRITQNQVESVYTAMLNGGTPAEILNPDSATFKNMSTAASDSLSLAPVNGTIMQTMMSPTGAEVQRGGAGLSLGDVPMWAWGIGALALFIMFKKS